MAPDKTSEFWHRRLREIAEEFPTEGAPKLQRRLEEIALESGRTDPPSVRWVGTRLKAHRSLEEKDRAPFGRFSWPAAMENGLLPWEASRVALDVLRNAQMGANKWRPTIEYVRWHWRLSLAAPALDFDLRDAFVLNIVMMRKLDHRLSNTPLDFLLAFQPWASALHRTMYDDAYPETPYWEEGSK